jgi:hypothetical protein
MIYGPFAEETPVVAHIVPAIDTIRRVTKGMEENRKFRRGQLGFAQAKGLNYLYLQQVQTESISVLRLSRRRNLDNIVMQRHASISASTASIRRGWAG